MEHRSIQERGAIFKIVFAVLKQHMTWRKPGGNITRPSSEVQFQDSNQHAPDFLITHRYHYISAVRAHLCHNSHQLFRLCSPHIHHIPTVHFSFISRNCSCSPLPIYTSSLPCFRPCYLMYCIISSYSTFIAHDVYIHRNPFPFHFHTACMTCSASDSETHN